MQTEISWRAVVIVGLLAVLGVVCSLLGEKTLGASLVGGALGYLAQGFAHKPQGPEGAVIDQISREISEKLAGKGGGTPRVQLAPFAAAMVCLWGLILACIGR